jgi:hypothetical protein
VNTNTGVINFTTNSVSGNYAIRLVASNSLTASVATNTLNLALKATTLTFSTTTNQIIATAGVAITPFTFVATPGTNSYRVASGDLFGLTLSTNGTLYGIPNTVGTNNVSVRASSGDLSATTTFNLAVASPTISVPSGELTTAGQILTTAGTSRTIPINKPDGFTSLTGTVTASPTYTGVSFNGENLVVSATAPPLPKGTDHVDLTLTSSRLVDGSTVSASTTVPLRVLAPVPTALVGTNAFEVDVGQPFNTTILSDLGSLAQMSFSNLPPGLTGEVNGVITGINRNSGLPNEYTSTVIANSSLSYEGGGMFTSNVTFRLRNNNPPIFTPLTNRVLGAVGKYFSLVLNASNSPYAFAASNVPTGLSLVGNTISGTPASAGIFTIPVTAYNSYRPGSTSLGDRQPGYGTVVLSVANAKPPASVAPASPGVLGKNVTIPLSDNRKLLDAVANGVAVSALGLPPGISLESTTGKIFGTPTTKGTFQVTVFIQNGKGWVRKGVTLTVQ